MNDSEELTGSEKADNVQKLVYDKVKLELDNMMKTLHEHIEVLKKELSIGAESYDRQSTKSEKIPR